MDIRTRETGMTRNGALTASLRALIHPASIAAVMLLALNDHLLKEAYPSWITGKLSDVAGLFFFPFLLSIPISLLSRGNTSTTGLLSFTITILWFTLAKATPIGNELTIDLVSAILGGPVSIVLDPADLIGLVSLIPAWRLWHAAARVDEPLRIEAAVPVAILAGLAVLGTSPSDEPFDAADLRVTGNTLLAAVRPGEEPSMYYTSTNAGRSWTGSMHWPLQSTGPLRDSLEGMMVGDRHEGPDNTATLIVQDPVSPRRLFRSLNGEPLLERSDDSGRTWKVVWKPAPGRGAFTSRMASLGGIEVLDMMMVPGSRDMIAAIDVRGVVICDSAGGVRECGYRSGGPFTTRAATFGEAIEATGTGWLRLISIALGAGAIMTLVAFSLVLRSLPREETRLIRRLFISLIVSSVGVFLMLHPILSGGDALVVLGMILYGVGGILLVVRMIGALLRARGVDPVRGPRVIAIVISTIAFSFLVPFTTLILWAFATIRMYQTAIAWGFGLTCASLAAHLILLLRLRRPSPPVPDASAA